MKNFTKFWGIIAVGAVIALSAAGCGSQTAEIIVTNNSQYEADATINVGVFMSGRSEPVTSRTVSKGQSVTISLDTGSYQVRVEGGFLSWSSPRAVFPQDYTYINMSGEFRLRYNGSTLTRTN